MPEQNNDVEYVIRPTASAVVAVVLGIGLILAAFFAYRYFNNVQSPELGSGVSTVNDDIPDMAYNRGNELDADNPTDSSKTNGSNTTKGSTLGAQVGGQNSGGPINVVWTANDLKKGDINGGNYTVKSGDTLWEIAEAKYGDGGQWVKIVNANSGKIGYLANGRHALIVTGQNLVLP